MNLTKTYIDQKLLDQISYDDDSALLKLLHQYHRKIRSMFYKRIRSRAFKERIVQKFNLSMRIRVSENTSNQPPYFQCSTKSDIPDLIVSKNIQKNRMRHEHTCERCCEMDRSVLGLRDRSSSCKAMIHRYCIWRGKVRGTFRIEHFFDRFFYALLSPVWEATTRGRQLNGLHFCSVES